VARDLDIGAILSSWASGDRPLYEQLAEALRRAIVARDLPPGCRLPAERELARLLAISRTTVAGAYEALKADGWLESRQGSGTRVRADLTGRDSTMVAGGAIPRLAPFWGPAADRDVINLTRSGFRGFDDFPRGAIQLPADELAALIDGSVGYDPNGLPELRVEVARWMTVNGLPTTPDEILITTGAQQAISLLAALYVPNDDPVILENPTFYGAIDAFRGVGARLLPVPLGSHGVDVSELAEIVERRHPALAYLTLSYHNPTGTVASEGVRRELAALVASTGLVVIDDLELAAHVIDAPPPPPLARYLNDEHIISIGSMSKLFWAGLRVGWVRAAPVVLARLSRIKMVADLGSSLPSQLIAARLLRSGEAIAAARREQLRSRRSTLEAAVAEHVPDWTYVRPTGGVYLWLRLPDCRDAFEFAQVAARHGVVITPGNGMSADGSFPDYVRIPFVEQPETIRLGIERLGEAWRTFTRIPAAAATPSAPSTAPLSARASTG
jgi:DNA-binding transcriptional MocR family regulator